MSTRQLYIGLMSGTSADGIDAVLVDMQSSCTLFATHTQVFPSDLRQQIHSIALPGVNEIDCMGALDVELGRLCAECVLILVKKANIATSDVIAIGSHGQTIRHRPPGSKEGCFTLQIGDPNIIAELTGITTVADFRRRDMAAGGQGAPLVPAFHHAMFHSFASDRAIVNIGGMANITWLPSTGSVYGFDTGPGNVLLDLWIHQHQGKSYDQDGQWAASGKTIPRLLDLLLEEPFFAKPYPKSTGRESFNRSWLDNHLQKLGLKVEAQDVQATLLDLTAISISDSIKQLGKSNEEVFICGGGAFNTRLMQRLADLLPTCSLATTAKAGVDPQWIEAMAFAWLAQQTMNHRPGNLCSVTGAKREVILGGVYFAH